MRELGTIRRLQSSRQLGMTLIELAIAMAVLALVLAMAIPSFSQISANSALRGTAMDLVMAVNTARAESVSLRVPVDMVPVDGNDWASGWRLEFPAPHDEMNSDFVPRSGVQVAEASALTAVQFRPNGTASVAAEFSVCDGRTGERGRTIRLNRLGRLNNQEVICP